MKKLLVMTAIMAVSAASSAMEREGFEGNPTGSEPHGWTLTLTGKGDPKWTVESDETAPSKPNVLKQSGKATYPLALKEDVRLRDGYVETKFKALSGSEDQAGGLVWRARDAGNYYVVRANALENNVVLYKTVGGRRSALDIVGRQGGYGVNIPVAAQHWHSLAVEFRGSRFKVLLNGTAIFEVEDRTFSAADQIGLWTKADSVTLFDDFSWQEVR